MKHIVLTLFIAIFSLTAFAQTQENENNIDGAKIEFDKKVHDYGTIEHKGNGDCTFTLKNTGNKPLILKNVRTSCGCTAASWPRKPIPAGESKKIEVKYDTKRLGSFSKSITVYSNTSNSPIRLKIKGKVER